MMSFALLLFHMQTIPDKFKRPDSTRIIPCTSSSNQRRNSSCSATRVSTVDSIQYHAGNVHVPKPSKRGVHAIL